MGILTTEQLDVFRNEMFEKFDEITKTVNQHKFATERILSLLEKLHEPKPDEKSSNKAASSICWI